LERALLTPECISLPSRVLGRKIKKFGTIFVKMYFEASWGEGRGYNIAPLYTPGYGYAGDDASCHNGMSGILSL